MIDNLVLKVDYMVRNRGGKTVNEMLIRVENHAYSKYIEHKTRQKDFRVPVLLGIKIQPEQYHEENYLLGNDAVTLYQVEEIRAILHKIKTIYHDLKISTGKEPPAHEIRRILKTGVEEKVRKSIWDFIPEYVEANQLAEVTARVYTHSLVGALKRFLRVKFNSEELYLDAITPEMVYKFEIFMHNSKTTRGKAYTKESAMQYVDKFKAVIRHARKVGELSKDILDGYDGYTSKVQSEAGSALKEFREGVSWKIRPSDLEKIELLKVGANAIKGDTETLSTNQYGYDLEILALPMLIW